MLRDDICKVSLPCSEAAFTAVAPYEETGKIDRYNRLQSTGLSEPSPLARLMIIASALSRCSGYIIRCSDEDLPPWDVRSEYQRAHSALLYLETELHFERPVHDAVERLGSGLLNSHDGDLIVISYALYHLCHCLLSHGSLLQQKMVSCAATPPPTFMRYAAQDNQTHAIELSRILEYSSTSGLATRCSFLSYCAMVSAVLHAVNLGSQASQSQQQSKACLEISSQFLANNTLFWRNSSVMVSNNHTTPKKHSYHKRDRGGFLSTTTDLTLTN